MNEDLGHLIEFPKGFRSGFCAILGRPNAGKSTLMNALIGEKVTIVSDRPQTTRDSIRGIVSDDTSQIVFIDTPGIIDPHDRLNEALMLNVHESMEGIDAALYLIDATERPEISEAEGKVLHQIKCPLLVLPTKVDLLQKPLNAKAWLASGRVEAEAMPVSATNGKGLKQTLAWVRDHLPEGPPLFDPEQITDRDMRFIASETIREKIFHHTDKEIPYCSAVVIDDYREQPGHKVTISATIHIERDSQKGIVIGKHGAMIKQIGSDARADLEALLGEGVFLELHVKVRRNWRRSDNDLRMFGYPPPRLPKKGKKK